MDTSISNAFKIAAILHRAGLFGVIWIALVAGDASGLVVGLVIVPLVVRLSFGLLPARNPIDLWRLALHLPRFIAGSVAGGVDVARRAFSPSMQLSPDWVRVAVRLPRGARAALGAEISLMPGTLAAGTDEDSLLVHVLTSKDSQVTADISRLETELAGMLTPSPGAGNKAAS